jgi:hypothetical protein
MKSPFPAQEDISSLQQVITHLSGYEDQFPQMRLDIGERIRNAYHDLRRLEWQAQNYSVKIRGGDERPLPLQTKSELGYGDIARVTAAVTAAGEKLPKETTPMQIETVYGGDEKVKELVQGAGSRMNGALNDLVQRFESYKSLVSPATTYEAEKVKTALSADRYSTL